MECHNEFPHHVWGHSHINVFMQKHEDSSTIQRQKNMKNSLNSYFWWGMKSHNKFTHRIPSAVCLKMRGSMTILTNWRTEVAQKCRVCKSQNNLLSWPLLLQVLSLVIITGTTVTICLLHFTLKWAGMCSHLYAWRWLSSYFTHEDRWSMLAAPPNYS